MRNGRTKRAALLSVLAAMSMGCAVGVSIAGTRPEPAETPEESAAEVLMTCLEEPEEPAYTDEELETLALIIYQEAGGDAASDETRLMVGNVFLNRVADERFPDTFFEVATAPKQYGQLAETGLVWPKRSAEPGEAHAVDRAYAIAIRLLEGERVLSDDVVWQAEFEQGTEIVAFQDNLYFCR